MKVTLVVIGKTDSEYLQKGIDEYTKRVNRYVNFEMKIIPVNKGRTNDDVAEKEILKLFSATGQGKEILLLDENGKQPTSIEFSTLLEKKMVAGLKELIFITGGPYGFSEEIHNQAGNNKLSLSKMTFSHQMVRILFLEQLYRAFTILKGEPYHHI